MSVVLLGSTSGSVTLQEPAIAGSTVIDLPATSGTMAVLPTATSVLPEASGGTGTTTGYYGFKNRLINGGMVIDQRNAGASSTPSAYTYTVDRWALAMSQASKFTVGQNLSSATPPVGFPNYLGVSTASAVTVGSGDYFFLRQYIEGFNFADMAWGTANAKTVTLSFQVYSSLTGTFGGALTNGAATRSYPFTYTVAAANTWTSVSVTIAGDTSGTWIGATNGIGCAVIFGLGAGSTYSGTANTWASAGYFSATGATSVVGTSGATFYITGVQLEKGSTATSFDYRPYGTELQLCQRYFEKSYPISTAIGTGGSGVFAIAWNSYSFMRGTFEFKVNKRTTPTLTFYNGTTGATGTVQFSGSGAKAVTTVTLTEVFFDPTGSGLWTTDDYCFFHWSASSEL
jgi:hypothetical protein